MATQWPSAKNPGESVSTTDWNALVAGMRSWPAPPAEAVNANGNTLANLAALYVGNVYVTGGMNLAGKNLTNLGVLTFGPSGYMAAGSGVGGVGLAAWQLTAHGNVFIRRPGGLDSGHALDVGSDGSLIAQYRSDFGGEVGPQWLRVTFGGLVSLPQKRCQIGSHGGVHSAIPVTDANLMLYRIDDNNWAGFGVDDGGSLWIRTGLSGTPDARMVFFANGRIKSAPLEVYDDNVAAVNTGGLTAGMWYRTPTGQMMQVF